MHIDIVPRMHWQFFSSQSRNVNNIVMHFERRSFPPRENSCLLMASLLVDIVKNYHQHDLVNALDYIG